MLKMLLLLLLLLPLSFAVTNSTALAAALPTRPANAPTGSQFATRIKGFSAPRREAAILKELESGNVPDFLRHLTPIKLRLRDGRGAVHTATLRVMPDYLAIGTDQDFVRIPMTPDTAQLFAQKFGYMLPTPKIVDDINRQAQVRLNPSPLPPGRQMASTDFYVRHQKMIEKQRGRGTLGKLTVGQKKDVVITKRLISRPSQVAIYGWHRRNGKPIQPLSLVHEHSYADYSHGIRLVARQVEIDGKTRNLDEVIGDRNLAPLVSNEGSFSTKSIAYASHRGGGKAWKAKAYKSKVQPKSAKMKEGGKKSAPSKKQKPRKSRGKGRGVA